MSTSASSIVRGSLLQPSGAFQVTSAAKVKSSIKQLKVFQNDNAKNASILPFHGIDLWRKAIGDRLRYSGIELRKSIEKVDGVEDRMYVGFIDAGPRKH